MKKKVFSRSIAWFLSMVMVFIVFGSSVDFFDISIFTAGATSQASITYTVNSDNTVTITGYKGIGGNVTIPSTINGKSVKSIGFSAFHRCTDLTSITIPNSVTSIGDFAFYECTGLTSITIPNSVTSIGDSAFFGCKGLANNKGFVIVKNILFDYLGNDLHIMLPANVIRIDNNAFSGCTGIKSMTIPNSVTSIGYYAFSGCIGLTSITIPNSVTSIASGAFSGCTGLTSITIPNSVTSISDETFFECTRLTSVTIPNSVTYIGFGAFCDCTGLTSITIPDSVTRIDKEAFTGCVGLTNITIPNSVVYIGNMAFRGCTGLADKKGFVIVEKILFDYCGNDLNVIIPANVTYIDNYAFSGYTEATSITISNSVTSIGEGAFAGCKELTSIIIPNSVEYIGAGAFAGCTGLASISISNSVTSIGWNTFSNCTSLTSVTIPNSVTSIGFYAFDGCTGLKDVYYTGKYEEWQKIEIDSNNKPLINATIHFNWREADTGINIKQYRFYYSSDTIVPGDTLIVGADKLGGNYTGTYYPGKVEWEISDRTVIDFIPIHDPKTGKDIPYYEDSTQLHLKAKNFGESTLTLKLDGIAVCSEKIKVNLTDDSLVKHYKDQILNSSVMTILNQGKADSYNVVKSYSTWDQWKIGFMTSMDNYLGFGVLLKWAGSSLGLTTSQYEDYVDESVKDLIADYLSIDSNLSEMTESIKNKYDVIKSGINVGDSNDFGIKQNIIIQELVENTNFSQKQISNVIKYAGKFVDSGFSAFQVGTTAVILAQFDLDVLYKLSGIVSSVPGDCASDMYKSIQRYINRVSDIESYVDEMMAGNFAEQLISFAAELWIEVKNLSVVGLIFELGDFLASWYKASGGILADEYTETCIAFNNAWTTYRAIESCQNMRDLKFEYDMYVASIRVALKYAERLAEEKENQPHLKENVVRQYHLIEQNCSFEIMIQEARNSAQNMVKNNISDQDQINGQSIGLNQNGIVSPLNSKTTSSGASVNAANTNDVMMIPSNINGYNNTRIAEEGFTNLKGYKGIVFPDTIRSIGKNAFSGCNDLEYVCLNDQLEVIEGYAFNHCEHLTYINLPKSITIIGEETFSDCVSLRYIELNANSIGNKAFANCVSLSEVRFNNKETVIGKNVFAGCSDDLIITGYKNSTAEQYAKANGISFEVIPEYVESLKIISPANKAEYTVGEEVDTTGLKIKVVYKDGSTETLTEGWITAYNTASVGNSKVTIIYGEKSVSYNIKVLKGEDPTITLSTSSMKMLYGTGMQLHADITSPTGYTPTITYSSSNPKIAQVSSTGYIRALKPGKVQITASIPNTDVSAICKVTVSNIEAFDTTNNNNVVRFTPTNDNFYLLTLSSDKQDADISVFNELQSEVSKTKIDDKQWMVILAADTLYTITTEAAKSIKIEEYAISSDLQIVDDGGTPVTELTAKVGDTINLSAQAVNKNSIEDEYYWKSDNNSIASISDKGSITCNTEGNTTIRVITSHFVTKEIPINVDANKPLNNTSKLSAASIAIGESIKITASASGGTKPYTYAIYYKKASATEWTTIQSFADKNTVTIKPAAAVKYDICVKVKDKTGQIEKKYFTVDVIKPLTNDSAISSDSVIKGKPITVTAKASGGTKPYTYAVYYKKAEVTAWTNAQSFADNTSVNITPDTAGKYNICVKVKDKTGQIEKKYFTVDVTVILTNNSTLSATTVRKGETITITAKATGGTTPYQYAFYYSFEGGTAKTLKAYSSSSKAVFSASAAGKYSLIVKIKDTSSKVARKDFNVVVYDKSYPLKSTSRISSDSITLGNKVKITAGATGGTGYYQYAFYYRKSGETNWKTISTYGAECTTYFKPTNTGNYEILAKIKDSNNKIVKSTFNLTVTATTAKIQFDVIFNRTVVYAGQDLCIETIATGGTGFYKYGVYFKKKTDTEWTTVKAFSAGNETGFTLPSSGEYEVCVKVRDSSNSTVKKYYDVKAKLGTAPIRNLSTVSAKTITLGKTIKMTGACSGGTSYYEYLMVYRMVGEEDWTTLQNYGANNIVTFKPELTGTYELCIKVADFEGANEEIRFILKAE